MTGNPDQSWHALRLHRLPLSDRLWLLVLPWIEALNRRCSKVGNPSFFDTALFPWVAGLEREWRTIRTELEDVLRRGDELPGFHEIVAEVGVISRDRDWKTFILLGMGHVAPANVARCPQTWRIVRRIPGVASAMFSIFEPGKHLPPHRGPYNGLLRLHLGLIVPNASNDVAIRVRSDVRHWNEGAALILDDAYEHEAWNDDNRQRVVLFVDFPRPLRFPANLLNALVLKLAHRSPITRDGYEKELAWERAFYGRDSTNVRYGTRPDANPS